MIDLAAGFVAVTEALDQADVRYVVVGSMAAARWGVARTTRDIDLVLVVNPQRCIPGPGRAGTNRGLCARRRWRLESRSEVQWRDCVEIAAVNDLDRQYLWRWAGVLGVADDLADLLGEQPPADG